MIPTFSLPFTSHALIVLIRGRKWRVGLGNLSFIEEVGIYLHGETGGERSERRVRGSGGGDGAQEPAQKTPAVFGFGRQSTVWDLSELEANRCF